MYRKVCHKPKTHLDHKAENEILDGLFLKTNLKPKNHVMLALDTFNKFSGFRTEHQRV